MKFVSTTDILRHELIGLEVNVWDNNNIYNNGIKGEILDETRNTLTIRHKGIPKKVAKGGTFFIFNLGNKFVEIEGKTLIGRPEDRIKKKNRKNW